MAVHECMRLHITTEKYIIEPIDTGINELLVIDRVSQEISLQANEGQIPASAVSRTIYGIFGIIRLLAGPYLILITRRSKIGEVNGHTIWKVTGTDVLPYKRTTHHLTEQQTGVLNAGTGIPIIEITSKVSEHTQIVEYNKEYLRMVDYMLKTESHYFSTTYDLTHTQQRLFNTSPEFLSIPLHERADVRFVWNGHVMKELAQQTELSRYCLPIVHGFITCKACTINGKAFDYILISRRSCFRAGTRYYMRGLDTEGHAANFIETEQILEFDGNRCSFVQTRGSIPLYWSQRPNLKYKPTPMISSTQNHVDGFNRHFDTQVYNYGKQVLINLIDHKGSEKQLENTFAQAVNKSQNSNVRYEYFDFHHECRRMRWDRLSILVDRLAQEQKQFGFFLCLRDGSTAKTQDGVFRTNCIDCLDRTNVVQSLMARKSLQEQFQRLGIIQQGERVEDHTHFEFIFKNVWADNADACAKQYAGTGALKTDFTRTGTRTKLGLLKDGVNSAIRYVKNNFYDGFRQDSIDLFLGNYIVEESEGITKPSPIKQENEWKFYTLPLIFIVAMTMCVISILMPDEHLGEQIMYILFWSGASVITMGFIYFYGNEFVNQPKLAQVKSKVD